MHRATLCNCLEDNKKNIFLKINCNFAMTEGLTWAMFSCKVSTCKIFIAALSKADK